MSGLPDFIKKRLKELKDNAQTVGTTANRAIVQPAAHVAGNVVHAGATAARDIGGAAQATGRFVAATPDHNVVLPVVKEAAKSTVKHFAVDLPKSVYDISRGAAADLTHNPVALQHANEAKAKDEGAFLQPVARPVVQAVRTIEHPFTPNSYQAKGRDAKVIFGDQPVQNVAAGVKSTYDEHPNLSMPQRLLLAGGYGVGQVVQDAATIAGAKLAGGRLVHGTAEVASKAAKTTKDIATGKPFRNIPDVELAAANRVSMQRTGHQADIQPGDLEAYQSVQRKLGVDPNDHATVDNVIGARMTYDTRMSLRGQPKLLKGSNTTDLTGNVDKLSEGDIKSIVDTHRKRFDDTNVKLGGVNSPNTLGKYSYENDMINLARGGPHVVDTLNHEHVHKAIGQFLSDSEIEGLYKDIVNVRGGRKAIQKEYQSRGYKGISWRSAAEEEIANTFVDFLKESRVAISGNNTAARIAQWASAKGLPQSVIDVLRRLSDRIQTHYATRNVGSATNLEKFYEKVNSGELKGATRRSSKYSEPLRPNNVLDKSTDRLIGHLIKTPYPGHLTAAEKLQDLKHGNRGSKLESVPNAKSPHENFEKEYANALRHMDSGMVGGQMIPDGEGGYTRMSEHSSFYSSFYKEHKHAPREADWLAESRRQLHGGKADSYAQAEYDQLKTAHMPIETPQTLAAKAKEYFANEPKATADYQAHTMDEFGTSTPNIVSGDSAKFIVNGGKTLDPTHSVPYHEAASAFAKDYYKKLLADPATKDKPVLITGGGAGAGKTSSLTKLGSLEDYAAVNDTNLTTLQSAETRIEPALQSGRKVQVAYVFRDPVDAFTNGNVPRGNKIGRIVPIAQHMDTHLSSLETIKQVAQKYKDNPDVEIKVIDNSRGPGAAKLVADPIAFLKDKVYNKGKLEQDLLNELKQAESNGTVSANVAKAYREGLGAKPGGQPKPQYKSPNPVKGALERSAKTDKPTALSDALVVKNQKLQASRGKPAVSKPTSEAPALPPTGRLRQNRLTKGAKQGRQNVSEAVSTAVDAKHVVRDTKALQASAVSTAEAGGLDNTIADAHKALQAPKGEIDDKTVALTQQAIERADTAGRTEDAVNLHDQLSQHLTKQGQSIQAASLFYKLSPQGQLYKALRDIKKGGGTVPPELEAKLRKQVDDIKNASDPKLDGRLADIERQMDEINAKPKPTAEDEARMERLTLRHDELTTEKQLNKGHATDYARARFQKTVREAIPQSKLQGALSVWKAGMLSGPKTHTGNVLSNATFAALKKVSDAPAAALDHVLSLKTKKRTKAFTVRGTATGTAQGVRSGMATLRTGIDLRDVGNGGKLDVHGELNFKNPVIQKVFGQTSNAVFRAMNAGDQPFYYAAARNNLHDMALAEAKTRKLSGTEADDFVKNLVANPTQEMAEKAKLAAQKAVLGQDSKLAASLSHLAQEHPSVQVLAPFIKVPTNFLTRTLDYTPVGYIKAAVNAMKDKRAGRGFDQRTFVEAVGEATTGTAILYLGAELAAHKFLSGAYPTDPKEQQRWKAEGITPNSIHIGNKWVSLNYLGPLGLLLGAGKSYHDAAAEGNNGWTQALASFGKNLAGQSFLSGFNSFANALTDPSRYLSNLKNSEAGSLVPSWANDLANVFDSKQRQASTVPETIRSRIPGARNRLPEKTDVYGNTLTQREGSSVPARADQATNPLRPSLDMGKKDPVVAEVGRLHRVDPNNTDLQVTPTPPTSINIEGKTVKLSSDQKYELQNKVGAAVRKKWGELIKTPEYRALDDAGKAKALSGLRGDATTLVERQYVVDNNLGTYQKAPGRRVQALGQDEANLPDYATKAQQSSAGGVVPNKSLDGDSRKVLAKYNAMSSEQRTKSSYSDNGFDYKVAQAKYNNDVANGKLSKAGKIKAVDSLEKSKAGAGYSRDVRDLYGLGGDDLSAYLASSEAGVDKKKMAADIIAYGDALVVAGVTDKNKFRNKAGAVTLGQTSKPGGSKFKTASIPSVKNNPYKTGGTKKPYKQVALPKLRNSKPTRATYKTAKLSTNINAKLRKA